MKIATESPPDRMKIVLVSHDDQTVDHASSEHSIRISSDEESIPVNQDARSLQSERAALDITMRARQPANFPLIESIPNTRRRPGGDSESQFCFASVKAARNYHDLLSAQLQSSFLSHYLEDGYEHPSSRIIERALNGSNPSLALRSLRAIALDKTRPSLAAAVIRCVGRIPRAGDANWRLQLIKTTLKSDSFEVREAAVDAVADWADPEFAPILESHFDPSSLLRNAIDKVISSIRH